ncbi:hypothetical protein [Kibdelosporangium philippinense]
MITTRNQTEKPTLLAPFTVLPIPAKRDQRPSTKLAKIEGLTPWR